MSEYNMDDFANMTDEELVAAYHDGNEETMEYICKKYKALVLKKAKYMFLIGGETDDLIQEGMLGLFKAIRSYDPNRQVTFYHFAEMCINGQINKAIEASNRKKNQPLNTYVSIYTGEDSEGDILEENLQADDVQNPENMLIDSEAVKHMRERVMGSLSAMEQQVLEYYLQGYDYHNIAALMNKTDKVIDNALQRIRQKVRKIL